MKVKLIKRWTPAGDAKPGDVVEIEDKFIQHGLNTGLCEKIVEVKMQTVAEKPKIPKARRKRRSNRVAVDKKSS